MRLVFFGTPDVAVPALDALVAAEDVDVVAVVTNPDRPRGRSRRPVPSPVKQAAEAAGIPVWQPERGRDVRDDLAAAAPDVCAVVAYGSILPRDVLDVPTHGFVNLHFSLLPRWRGAAPVQHAIRAGDTVTGLTTFVLDEGMDTGPLLATVETPIGDTETAGELLDRLALAGGAVLLGSLRDLVAGATATPQPSAGATLAPRIDPADVRIDWAAPAGTVAALVRSASPRPGAHTTWEHDRFKVLGAVEVVAAVDAPDPEHADTPDAATSPSDGAPGEVVVVDPGTGPVVACGTGRVRLTRVQPAGKAAMDATDWVNGYQPRPGQRFDHPGTA